MYSATDVDLFLKAKQSIVLASVWQRETLRGLFLNTNNQLSEKKNKEHNLIHNSTKNDKTLRNKFNQKDKDLYTKTIKLW